MDLYQKVRPKKLSEVIGQPEAVKTLDKYLRTKTLPHAIMFSGPSGTGKTTLALYLAKRLCGGDSMNVEEINCGLCEPLDTMRRIARQMQFKALDDKPSVFIFNEFQSFSRATYAQQGALDPFENIPEHVYHFITTTDTSKIHKAVKTRMLEIKTRLLSDVDVKKLVTSVALKEDCLLTEKVRNYLTELAEGSARSAMVLLSLLIGVPQKFHMARLGRSDEAVGAAIELPRLLSRKGTRWKVVAECLKRLRGEDPERLRRLVTDWMGKAVLSGNPRGMVVLQAFREPTFVGFDDIIAMSWDAVHAS